MALSEVSGASLIFSGGLPIEEVLRECGEGYDGRLLQVSQ